MNKENKEKKQQFYKSQKDKKPTKGQAPQNQDSDLKHSATKLALNRAISSKEQKKSVKIQPSNHFLKEKNKQKESSGAGRQEKALLDKKLKQALEDNLYLRAEFENFKRRSAEEKKQLLLYAGESLLSSLADEVLDDLDRALLFAEKEKSFENLKKGLDMIHKKLSQVLNRFGVEVLDPFGKVFDPSYQEALSHIQSSDIPEGHVAETFKKAYKLHDKVIRPAQVVLAKKKEKI